MGVMQTVTCSECGEVVPLAVDTSMGHPHDKLKSVCMNCWIEIVDRTDEFGLAEKEEKEL